MFWGDYVIVYQSSNSNSYQLQSEITKTAKHAFSVPWYKVCSWREKDVLGEIVVVQSVLIGYKDGHADSDCVLWLSDEVLAKADYCDRRVEVPMDSPLTRVLLVVKIWDKTEA